MSTPQEDLVEALAAVQRTSTLAAQRTTALAEMQRERDEAQRQLSEMAASETFLLADNEQTLTDAAEGWERAERYRLAWVSAVRRARRYDDLVDELDERVEIVRGQRNACLGANYELMAERDEARAEVVRLGRALDRATCDQVGDHTCNHGEDEVSAATDRLRAALDEKRIEPQVCPPHGAHPHNGLRCLDCPVCVGELRTEGEAG